MKFCTSSGLLCCVVGIALLSPVLARGETEEGKSIPEPAVPEVSNSKSVPQKEGVKVVRFISQKKNRPTHRKSNARTFGMFDRILDSMGFNSITWVPGLRSLMDMNNNGTAMEFIPLGRLIWNRFFGESSASTLLSL
ncbi:uncharacterized protein LOC110862732 [Folsomia candida]|uniref:Venom nerve growth factor n=1 Tax=Folsomia candida TaxID=158441 RepID=A0A226CWX8_FOLCA|nr:uncharacterized protein LOC110862732 [Folsomia candida]OXA37018.1 Venom nerve growth factor [Folsomia candida]